MMTAVLDQHDDAGDDGADDGAISDLVREIAWRLTLFGCGVEETLRQS